MTGNLDIALLVAAAVLLVAVAAVRLSTRLGLPGLLVYLLIGMGLGEAGLGIQFTNAELTRSLGFCALIVIIAEGGLTARWSTLRPVLGLSAVLATFGVVISVAVVGLAVHYVLRLDWRLALLYGAVSHASGFLAVYVAGVVLGNGRLPHRQAILGFADGLAWVAQIGLFVLLGLLVSPQRLPAAIVPALVAGCALVFLA